jgi:hypothetical protein
MACPGRGLDSPWPRMDMVWFWHGLCWLRGGLVMILFDNVLGSSWAVLEMIFSGHGLAWTGRGLAMCWSGMTRAGLTKS